MEKRCCSEKQLIPHKHNVTLAEMKNKKKNLQTMLSYRLEIDTVRAGPRLRGINFT